MPVDINWSLARSGGGGAMGAFKQGRELGSEIRRSQALRAYAKNPQDPEVLNDLIAVAPELGFKAADFQRKRRADLRDDQFSEATTDYLGPNGEGNALLGVGRGPVSHPSDSPTRRSIIPPLGGAASTGGTPGGMPAQNALAAFTGQQGHWPAPGDAPQPQPPSQPQGSAGLSAYTQPQGSSPDQAPQLPDSRQEHPDPELAILGTPQTGRDRAFLKMIRIDPIKALKLRTGLRDNFVKNLKDTREVYRFGIERLSQASDEQGYQSVLAELEPMTQAIGGNLLDHVPANYPGPEGMRELLTKALDAKEQVSAFMQQANIDEDNERADRNTDSTIADRDARRADTRQYRAAQTGTAQRGQDIRSRDARRGQDKRGSGRSGLVQVKTRAEAEALPSGTKFRDPNGVVRTRP